MTSAQTMFLTPLIRAIGAGVSLLAAAWIGGCADAPSGDRLVQPTVEVSPYDPSRGEVLWAVVPLRNESGTSLADPLVISDALVGAVSEVRGLRCLPINRTIEAMRALELGAVQDPADAAALAKVLGVDGLIIGTITAYDPYDPPTLGVSLGLYVLPGSMSLASAVDPRELTYQPAEWAPRSGVPPGAGPAASVSEHLDAHNHEVLAAVRQYAQGRHDPARPLGWRRYVMSMDLYTQFAAHHLVAGLVAHERRRLADLAARQHDSP